MTLAFFMFAGKLPVRMFSFMIRTLVSFCRQEGTIRQVQMLTLLSRALNLTTVLLSGVPGKGRCISISDLS